MCFNVFTGLKGMYKKNPFNNFMGEEIWEISSILSYNNQKTMIF